MQQRAPVPDLLTTHNFGWLGGVVVRSRTSDSEVAGSSPTRTAVELGLSGCRLRGPKSVRSGNGLPLLALRHLVSLPVSTPLRIVNRCLLVMHVLVSGGI